VAEKPAIYLPTDPVARIVTVRGQKVILDSDLAAIYGVETKRLNEQVKRNADRFPSDFMFRLTVEEVIDLRSQIATSSSQSIDGQDDEMNRSQIATASYGGRRYRPYAFTEHGAIMVATVLNSPRAVQMSVFVVRAFIRMRAALADNRELARKLAALEKEIKARLDVQESAIVDTLRRLMEIIDPPTLPEPPRKQIGFQVKESRGLYRVRRKGRTA
jgi:hypothetical protein